MAYKVIKVEPYVNETIQEATERIINQLEEDATPLVDLFVVNGDVNVVYEFYPEEVLGIANNNWHLYDEANLADMEDEEGFV